MDAIFIHWMCIVKSRHHSSENCNFHAEMDFQVTGRCETRDCQRWAVSALCITVGCRSCIMR